MTQSGFTLIECITVVAIISIVALLSINLLNLSDQIDVRTELEKFFAFARYIQRKASIEKKTKAIELDIAHQSYGHDVIRHKLAGAVIFGMLPGAKGSPGVAHELPKQPSTFKHNKIECYPDGTISAGTLYFTNVKKNCLYALTSAVAHVPYLRKYRYDRQWKLID